MNTDISDRVRNADGFLGRDTQKKKKIRKIKKKIIIIAFAMVWYFRTTIIYCKFKLIISRGRGGGGWFRVTKTIRINGRRTLKIKSCMESLTGRLLIKRLELTPVTESGVPGHKITTFIGIYQSAYLSQRGRYRASVGHSSNRLCGTFYVKKFFIFFFETYWNKLCLLDIRQLRKSRVLCIRYTGSDTTHRWRVRK